MRVLGITAVDGQRITVRARKDREGESKVATTVVLTVLFGPLGLLKRGKDASIPAGTKVAVFVDGEIDVVGCPVQPNQTALEASAISQPPFDQGAASNRNPDSGGSREDAATQLKRGLAAYEGTGASQKYSEALEWFRKAADQGDAEAMSMLATMYANAEGAQRDFREAHKWASAADERAPSQHRGDVKTAIARLGKMSPQQVAESEKAARDWIQALEQGNRTRPTTPSLDPQGDRAATIGLRTPLRREAANQGDADAMLGLGLAYYQGEGVLQDYVEAHKWANLAAVRAAPAEQPRAIQLRDAIASKMTSQQVAEAQSLAREWMAAFERGKK